jgi:hypothetical protein
MNRLRLTILCALFALLGAPLLAEARITRIVITRVESPTFEGASFGEAGQDEKLVGRAFGEVDPADPRDVVIADISLAPRNSRGMVEYSTDIYILRPVVRSRGNHRLFFEINNRGRPCARGIRHRQRNYDDGNPQVSGGDSRQIPGEPPMPIPADGWESRSCTIRH